MGARLLSAFVALAALGLAAPPAAAATLPPGYAAGVPHADGLRDLGRATAATRVELAFVLKYRHEAELDRLIEQQGDPRAQAYGRVLPSTEFESYFSPSPAAYSHTIAALRRAGFTVSQTFRNRLVVDAHAPAPVAERYFATEIHRVVQPGHGIRYANSRPALLPVELREDVEGVVGLNNIEWFKTTEVRRPSMPPRSIGDVVIGPPLHGPAGGFGPLAWAQGYDMPVQHQIPGKPSGTTYDGTGRTAGIVIPADPSDSDLAQFLTFFKVKRTGTTNRIHVDGPGPCP
jgi:hypothetical protein